MFCRTATGHRWLLSGGLGDTGFYNQTSLDDRLDVSAISIDFAQAGGAGGSLGKRSGTPSLIYRCIFCCTFFSDRTGCFWFGQVAFGQVAFGQVAFRQVAFGQVALFGTGCFWTGLFYKLLLERLLLDRLLWFACVWFGQVALGQVAFTGCF